MAIAASAIGYFLQPVNGGPGSFAVVVLYALICGAYIPYHFAREEHPHPIRRALRRAREGRERG